MKIGTGAFFTGSSLFQTFSGMAISFYALSLIGPEKMGLWHTALLIKPYLGFAQFGLTEGLGRELPFYMGKKEDQKVKEYASNAQFITTVYTIIFFIISIIVTLFWAEGVEEQLVYLTAGVFISTMFIDNFLSSTYRSSKSFRDLSKVYIYAAVTGLLLMPLIYFLNFKGYMLLLLIHSLISTLLLITHRPFKIRSIFNREIYKNTLKIGLPMLSLNFLRRIPDTYPKIIIVFFISTTALGLTAPANAILMAFGVLPAALAKYIYPTITYQYGKDGDKHAIWLKIKQISVQLILLGSVGLVSILIIPYLIESFFPKYENSIHIAMIAVGIGFLRMFSILYNVFNTIKSYKEQFTVSLTRNLLYLIIPSILFFLSFGPDKLTLIFIGILIAEFISMIAMLYFLYKVTNEK